MLLLTKKHSHFAKHKRIHIFEIELAKKVVISSTLSFCVIILILLELLSVVFLKGLSKRL